MRVVLKTVMTVGLTLALCPAIAGAQTTEHYQATARVAGPDAAVEAIGMLREVELGAEATTLTLQVEGVEHDVRLDYGSFEQKVTGRDDGLLLPLAMIAVAVSTVGRGVRRLARFRRSSR